MLIPQKLLSRITDHFNGDVSRAMMWFHIPNPILNGMRPMDYKFNGSWKRLEKMIDDALEENSNEQEQSCTNSP